MRRAGEKGGNSKQDPDGPLRGLQGRQIKTLSSSERHTHDMTSHRMGLSTEMTEYSPSHGQSSPGSGSGSGYQMAAFWTL